MIRVSGTIIYHFYGAFEATYIYAYIYYKILWNKGRSGLILNLYNLGRLLNYG